MEKKEEGGGREKKKKVQMPILLFSGTEKDSLLPLRPPN